MKSQTECPACQTKMLSPVNVGALAFSPRCCCVRGQPHTAARTSGDSPGAEDGVAVAPLEIECVVSTQTFFKKLPFRCKTRGWRERTLKVKTVE